MIHKAIMIGRAGIAKSMRPLDPGFQITGVGLIAPLGNPN
jgi:hypothetical protein